MRHYGNCSQTSLPSVHVKTRQTQTGGYVYAVRRTNNDEGRVKDNSIISLYQVHLMKGTGGSIFVKLYLKFDFIATA